jgi:hypothetical protein
MGLIPSRMPPNRAKTSRKSLTLLQSPARRRTRPLQQLMIVSWRRSKYHGILL